MACGTDSSAQHAFPALCLSLHPQANSPVSYCTPSQPCSSYHALQFSCRLFHSINYYISKPLLIFPCRNVKELAPLFSINKESKWSGKCCQILQRLVFPLIVEIIKRRIFLPKHNVLPQNPFISAACKNK